MQSCTLRAGWERSAVVFQRLRCDRGLKNRLSSSGLLVLQPGPGSQVHQRGALGAGYAQQPEGIDLCQVKLE
jgi:hypothetical protein